MKEVKTLDIPSWFKLKNALGTLKTGCDIDEKIYHIVKTLMWKYGICTIGCCQGHTVFDFAWIQIGNTWENDWLSEFTVKNILKIIEKEFPDFPIGVYDPRYIPTEKQVIWILKKHYLKMLESGVDFKGVIVNIFEDF
ncbi:hypothetical protein [Fusobacterium necrophorum]|uniref:hypothetical protein n=1 Tax=Fusobacterium necrophorum TaxID=859 RepID=UPI00370DE692